MMRGETRQSLKLSCEQIREGMRHLTDPARNPLAWALQEHLNCPMPVENLLNSFSLDADSACERENRDAARREPEVTHLDSADILRRESARNERWRVDDACLRTEADCRREEQLREERRRASELPCAEVEPADNARYLQLQSHVRLSKSMLWDVQEEFYGGAGIQAWNGGVPFFATNSTFIAETYAELIRSCLLDCIDSLDCTEPVYIVELAAGSGRFSHHLVRELCRKLEATPELRDVRFRYIMTDMAEKNIAFWEQHPRLRPYIERGIVDFAVYRPEKYQTLNLRACGETLSCKQVKNPLIALGNYFFDTIRQDMFRVTDYQLEEGRMMLHRRLEEGKTPGPLHIRELEPTWNYVPVSSDYYEDPILNRILKCYQQELSYGSFVIPVGGFEALRNLRALANNNLILMTSDKGFTDIEYQEGTRDPHVSVHGGAFSFMVNFDAINRYFRELGGRTFCTNDWNASLQTVVCIERPEDRRYDRVDYMFRDRMHRNNPVNFLVEMQDLIALAGKETDWSRRINSMMAFIRMSLCDPSVFCLCAPMLAQCMDKLRMEQRRDLILMLETVWDNYYYFPGEVNLPFWMAEIYQGLCMYNEALRMLDCTVEMFGPHEALDYLRGRCCENLGLILDAEASYQCALDRRPDFPEARECLDRIRNNRVA